MATVARLITAEELLTFPSSAIGVRLDLVRGIPVAVSRPGFRHGRTQGLTGGVLDRYGSSLGRGRAVVGTGIVTERNPDTVRGPDVSYWSAERLPLHVVPPGYPPLAPDVAVEVFSPCNPMHGIHEKIREYFGCGVRMVWVIDPEDRTVTVYRSLEEGRLLHDNATLTCEDVLPGFSCKVAELLP